MLWSRDSRRSFPGIRVFEVRDAMKGAIRRVLPGLAIGATLALATAGPALASTVSISGGNTITVRETGNEVNQVKVTYDSGMNLYTVEDAAANLTLSGMTCATVDAHKATCPGTGITRIDVNTGDRDDSIVLDDATIPSAVTEDLDGAAGNDTVDGANSPGTVRGGSGDDRVRGRGTVEGGSGNDQVVGSPEADNIRGGSGRDSLDGGDGPDDIAGGNSADVLIYPSSRATPVNVTVGSGNNNDGGVEDQASGRRDNVRGDIESVAGTPANDALIGDSSSETLLGLQGTDFLVGNSGNDNLFGFEGDDLMLGGDGGDVLRGSFGNDRLLGGPDGDRLAAGADDDFLKGNTGSDVMKGKTGIDQVRAKDGTRDVKINCGPGPNGVEFATRDKRLDPRAKSC
jgi:Ca2+-binding RTX toxin-like protein